MNTVDRREHLRMTSNDPLVMIIDNQSFYATMTDFSRHGVGFMSSAQPDVDSKVELHFAIREGNTEDSLHSFQFLATVRHCIHHSHNHESHIGAALEISDDEYLSIFDSLSGNA